MRRRIGEKKKFDINCMSRYATINVVWRVIFWGGISVEFSGSIFEKVGWEFVLEFFWHGFNLDIMKLWNYETTNYFRDEIQPPWCVGQSTKIEKYVDSKFV